MKLYYTVATGANNTQPNVNLSLGGFCSSTPVFNDDFSNLFDELSVMTIRNNRNEYRAIVLKNEDSISHKNINITIQPVSDDAICSYKIALAQMTIVDKYGNKGMENILSQYSRPFNATFVDTSEEKLVISELKPNDMIGIWICRSIDKEKAVTQYHKVAEPDPTDPTGRRYRPVLMPKEESFDIIFKW